ncbi:MAG: response regulator [Nevskia sp.]|nr:response regulator [Nevskia sp.]
MRQDKDLPVILLAEDDPAHRLLTVKAFQKSQLPNPVHQVQDGEELMDYLLHQGRYAGNSGAVDPKVILLDLNMPRKSGLEALAEIKSNPRLRRIPVVVLTTSDDAQDVARSYDLGANSFITKPVDFTEFTRTIRQLGDYWLQLVTTPPGA